ncbi:MAG TPA: NADH-quinone oxidoreductase subunit L [Verrucomicrobiae bacterium]|nr:NADH-quinone oxidoreductase subunit L [Verrucomicrobiae bacterium]
MSAQLLWLIPLLPLTAAAILAVSSSRAMAALASIGAMGIALILSLAAFGKTLVSGAPQYWNFDWLQFGTSSLKLGFLLDPLTASMLVMVTFVGLLIFIYSTGYMAHDDNYTKFFCFMSLFAAGMLGVVVANSLLLLFFCWEIVGLASYLLIGFWFFKPSAAAAARKAFITTRIGDIGFFLGMIWLYSATGTLLFYDNGKGCLEYDTLSVLVTKTAIIGISSATLISLLIFCGAVGKSGQVPLHVWLPDAMEGPTPVSALIHAATMVAAGVFLVARVYPLMDADVLNVPGASAALTVVTWVGAITAVFAASIAVAQNDIKRILAYSTVSQLGFMMLGLGTGGVAVGIFHLLTHAFFKALLFLGAGSVIHGSHEEQDISKMGGLRATMPTTFWTYAVGMMALAGVPVFFAGFWSKDAILHSAWHWESSRVPFLLGVIGAFLTAFYMTRQMIYVFFGASRSHEPAHESPPVMTVPLTILAACAILLGFFGTPAWPWMQKYLTGQPVQFGFGEVMSGAFVALLVLSALIVGCGFASGYYLYGRRKTLAGPDILDERFPTIFRALRNRLFVDEAYDATFISFNQWLSRTAALVEAGFFASVGWVTGLAAVGFGWITRVFDNYVIDAGFDETCKGLQTGAAEGRKLQDGRIQDYLRTMAVALIVLVLLLVWGCKGS